MMTQRNLIQPEFDLDSTYEQTDTTGYDTWSKTQRRKYEEVASVWHLPLHRRVRVKLKWRPDELEGVLVLQKFPERLSSRLPLKLRVDGFDFDSTEIESCCRIK